MIGISYGKFALFALAALLGFTVESAAGFGAVILTLTISAFFLPMDGILTVILPINIVLSAILVQRYHRAVSVPLLVRGILPFMGLGMACAMVIRQWGEQGFLRTVFAGFVLLLSLTELFRSSSATETRPLSRPLRAITLFGAGVIHGFFACGGPMVVYVTAREVHDKAQFRTTLSALWLLLNVLLFGSMVYAGKTSLATLGQSLLLLPSLALGIVLGERVHARVPQARFRKAVFGGLVVAGGLLLVRSLRPS